MKKLVVLMLSICMIFCLNACGEQECAKCSGTGKISCTASCKNGKVECTTCWGEIYDECTTCSGEKYVRVSYSCEKCEDSKKPGYIYDSGKAIGDLYNGTMNGYNNSQYWIRCGNCHKKCSSCNGSGEGEKCPDCDVNGKKNCSYCQGTQKVSCTSCKGKGTIKQ